MGNTHSRRLEYMDCLRGVAMIFVIYFHLLAYQTDTNSAVNEFLMRWRMPLFFFISGFFALITNDSQELMAIRVKNRIFKQLYPTFVVWMIFIIFNTFLFGYSLTDAIKHGVYDPTKLGYWFTISLVEVYFIYILLAKILFKLHAPLHHQGIVYLALAVVISVVYLMFFQSLNLSKTFRQVYNVCGIGQILAMMPFFFLGLYFRINQERLMRILDNYLVLMALLVLFCLSATMQFEPDSMVGSIVYYLSRILGLMSVLSLFVCMKSVFNTATAAGRYLNRIGRNTLPIYLFHFFLIILIPYCFAGYEELKVALEQHWWIELPVVMAVSVIVAEICLAADRLLKNLGPCHRLIFNPI